MLDQGPHQQEEDVQSWQRVEVEDKELMVGGGKLHWYQGEDMLQASQSRQEAEAEGWLWGS